MRELRFEGNDGFIFFMLVLWRCCSALLEKNTVDSKLAPGIISSYFNHQEHH